LLILSIIMHIKPLRKTIVYVKIRLQLFV